MSEAAAPTRGGSPPVIIANPGSGRTGTSVDELRSAFGPDVRIVEVEGEDLPGTVDAALADGPAWLGVCGGDGSVRCAAGRLVGGDLPLLAVPGGTRNNFAKAVGCATLEAAAEAARAGEVTCVDVGEVVCSAPGATPELILNTSQLGQYASVVRARVRRRDRLPKRVADVVGAVEQAVKGRPLHVLVDGVPMRAWIVFVGPGPYGEGIADIARTSLTTGVLDVLVVTATGRLARLRVVGAALTGRLSRSPVIERSTATELMVDVPRTPRLDIAIDGDVIAVTAPLRWTIRPAALPVFVHPDETV